MNRKVLIAGLAVVLSLLGGFAAGWSACQARANTDIHGLALVHHLERLGFAANALQTIQAGHEDRLNKLLWFGMTSALDSAERELAEGAALPAKLPLPSLHEAVQRARTAAEKAANSALAERLTTLQSRLGEVR